MTDRELLELSAMAALGRTSIPKQHMEMLEKGWNPLESDEAALRLAVRLRMQVLIDPAEVMVIVDWGGRRHQLVEKFRAECQGEYEGVRRAIVRAAAEIGRAMP